MAKLTFKQTMNNYSTIALIILFRSRLLTYLLRKKIYKIIPNRLSISRDTYKQRNSQKQYFQLNYVTKNYYQEILRRTCNYFP